MHGQGFLICYNTFMKKNIYFFEVKDDERRHVTEQYPNVTIFSDDFSSEFIDQCQDAHVLCGMVHSDFSAENLSQFQNLELIVTRSVGYNHIDLKYCDENNIPVCHVPDYGSHVIAEHVFALLLASARKIIEGEEQTALGNFDEAGLCGTALKGKTIGIIGTGKIGSHVCRIASRGFLMNVIAYDLHPRPELAEEYGFTYVDSLDDIYAQSDFISLHAPLFPSTKHMINAESIAKMRDGVTLINTSRGGLIHTGDLISAIKAEKFEHVALDVIEHENNLVEANEILTLPNVIITPHIAYYTHDSVDKMYEIGLQSITEYLEGKTDLTYKVIGH